MFGFLKQRREGRIPAVFVDEVGVRRDLGDGGIEEVAWKDLVEVEIVTTDEGPFAEDVFILLVGAGDSGCCVPLGCSQSQALLRRLQSLPAFDTGKWGEAMGCAENARFVCWKKA